MCATVPEIMNGNQWWRENDKGLFILVFFVSDAQTGKFGKSE
jgi:hypothetical protein